MSLREPLNVPMMKHIAREIIAEEEEKWNIKLNIYPFTIIEYYKSDIFKKWFKLYKSIDDVFLPFTANGVNDKKGNSIIFVSNYHCYKKLEEKLFRFIFTCFHEYRHSIQLYFKFNTYDAFLADVDRFIRTEINFDYEFEHDKYSYEIGANLYAVRRASEYMQKKCPELYLKHKAEIEKKEQQYLFDYMTFDASDLIERAIKIIKFNKKLHNNKLVSDVSNKTNISSIIKIDYMDLPFILQQFMDENLNFKSIKEIMDFTKKNPMDKKIIYHILSCNSFLESINMEKLSRQELELLNESLKYTHTVYKNQMDYIEKHKNHTLEYSSTFNNIVKKMRTVAKYINDELNALMNISRNEKKRQSHIRNIDNYLNESEELINKRKNGYLTIEILYIISGTISIITIMSLIMLG